MKLKMLLFHENKNVRINKENAKDKNEIHERIELNYLKRECVSYEVHTGHEPSYMSLCNFFLYYILIFFYMRHNKIFIH